MEEIERVEQEGSDFSALFPLISGERARQVWKNGDAQNAMLTVGQSVGRIDDIPTVAELVSRMVTECQQSLNLAQQQVGS